MTTSVSGIFRALACAAVVCCGAVGALAADFRLAGSDLLGPELPKVLDGYAGPEGAKLIVALEGSRPAYEQLKTNRADLALITLPPDENVDPAVYEAIPLAWHRVVVVVPVGAPLNQITLPQLAAVFGAEALTSFNRWGELGVTSEEWAASPITPQAPAGNLGLTAELFRRVALKGAAFKGYVARYTSADDLAFRLAGDSRAMVVAPAIPKGSKGQKLLAVAASAEDPAFSPTAENISSGDYPLRLAVRIVYRREAAERVRPAVIFLLGDAVAAALEREEITPEPASVRRQRVLNLGKN